MRRDKVLWRLTPTVAEEHYIRDQAMKEGRSIAQMTHRLLSEAILARQATQHQSAKVQELITAMLTPTAEPDAH
jgi:hypothetical protein